MPKAKWKDNTPKQILKRSIDEEIDNFLSITIKILSKKRGSLNTFKWKSNKRKPRSKTIIISSFDNSGNKPLLTLILRLIPNIDIVNIAIIGTDTYCVTYKLKSP